MRGYVIFLLFGTEISQEPAGRFRIPEHAAQTTILRQAH